MNELASLAGLVAALAIGAVGPGPSFVIVARTSVSRSREQGLAAALGMGLGGLAFAVAALAGVQAALLGVSSVFAALTGLSGLYLVWLGIRVWRAAGAPSAFDASAGSAAVASGIGRAVALGLSTQLGNPKTAIVYASVFAALLPPGSFNLVPARFARGGGCHRVRLVRLRRLVAVVDRPTSDVPSIQDRFGPNCRRRDDRTRPEARVVCARRVNPAVGPRQQWIR
jgi:threonine/homoserine/homoserine lactone efflux protein